MSGAAPSEAGVGAEAGPAGWRVRPAAGCDVAAVASAVGELLSELGSAPPPLPAMEAAARALLDDPRAGALLVAEGAIPGESSGGNGLAGESEPASAAPAGGGASAAPTGAGPAAHLVGVLGASWQSAIHIPGRYALIQDLWVHPSWRGSGVGGGLLAALFELARERGLARVEVGLPRPRFAGLAATEAFYLANSFTSLGARMRRSLP